MTTVALEGSTGHRAATRRVDIAIGLGLFASVLGVEIVLALTWVTYGVFEQWNVLFDADPPLMRAMMVHGWSAFSIRHPVVNYYFSVPIRLIALAAHMAGLTDNQAAFREYLGLFIAPLCAAAKTVCFYYVFRLLELNWARSLLATLATCLAFSSVVFGAIPETYAVSGLTLAAVTLATVASLRHRDRLGPLARLFRIAAGASTIGTTISNVIFVGWMDVARRTCQGAPPRMALVRAVLCSALLLVGVGLVGKIVNTIHMHPENLGLGVFSVAESKDTGFVDHFLQSARHGVVTAARAPEWVARTFVPTIPGFIDNLKGIYWDQAIQKEITYNAKPFGLASAALWVLGLIMVVGGALHSYRLGGIWRSVGLASAVSVPSFFVVYAVFGSNTFLFTQLWHVPTAILIAAWLTRPWTEMKWFPFAAGVALIAWVAGDIAAVSWIDQHLATWAAAADMRPAL